MMKIRLAVVTTTMGELAPKLAPQAYAGFERAAYLRCMVADLTSVGGLTPDSSSAASLGAEAHRAMRPGLASLNLDGDVRTAAIRCCARSTHSSMSV